MRNNTIRSRLLLIVLVLALFVPAANGYALTQKQKAINAYKTMLSKSKVSILSSGTEYYDKKQGKGVIYKPTDSSKVQFAIAYIDNNDVPELIVKRSDGLYAIFTYKNNQIHRIKKGNTWDRVVGYYNKTGGYKVYYSTEGANYYNEYYQLTSSGTTKKFMKKVFVDPTTGKEYHVDYSAFNKGMPFDISYASFKSRFIALTKSKTLTGVKYHSNNATNRKNYLK